MAGMSVEGSVDFALFAPGYGAGRRDVRKACPALWGHSRSFVGASLGVVNL